MPVALLGKCRPFPGAPDPALYPQASLMCCCTFLSVCGASNGFYWMDVHLRRTSKRDGMAGAYSVHLLSGSPCTIRHWQPRSIADNEAGIARDIFTVTKVLTTHSC